MNPREIFYSNPNAVNIDPDRSFKGLSLSSSTPLLDGQPAEGLTWYSVGYTELLVHISDTSSTINFLTYLICQW